MAEEKNLVQIDDYFLDPNAIHSIAYFNVYRVHDSFNIMTRDDSGTIDFIHYNQLEPNRRGRPPRTHGELYRVADHCGNKLTVRLINTWNIDDVYDELTAACSRHNTMKCDIRDQDGFCMLYRKDDWAISGYDASLVMGKIRSKDEEVLAIQALLTMAFDKIDISHRDHRPRIFGPMTTEITSNITGFSFKFSPLFAAWSEIGFDNKDQTIALQLMASCFMAKPPAKKKWYMKGMTKF